MSAPYIEVSMCNGTKRAFDEATLVRRMRALGIKPETITALTKHGKPYDLYASDTPRIFYTFRRRNARDSNNIPEGLGLDSDSITLLQAQKDYVAPTKEDWKRLLRDMPRVRDFTRIQLGDDEA